MTCAHSLSKTQNKRPLCLSLSGEREGEGEAGGGDGKEEGGRGRGRGDTHRDREGVDRERAAVLKWRKEKQGGR